MIVAEAARVAAIERVRDRGSGRTLLRRSFVVAAIGASSARSKHVRLLFGRRWEGEPYPGRG